MSSTCAGHFMNISSCSQNRSAQTGTAEMTEIWIILEHSCAFIFRTLKYKIIWSTMETIIQFVDQNSKLNSCSQSLMIWYESIPAYFHLIVAKKWSWLDWHMTQQCHSIVTIQVWNQNRTWSNSILLLSSTHLCKL